MREEARLLRLHHQLVHALAPGLELQRSGLFATLGMEEISNAPKFHWMCFWPATPVSCLTNSQPASGFLDPVGMTVCMVTYWPNSLPLALGPPGSCHCTISALGCSLKTRKPRFQQPT